MASRLLLWGPFESSRRRGSGRIVERQRILDALSSSSTLRSETCWGAGVEDGLERLERPHDRPVARSLRSLPLFPVCSIHRRSLRAARGGWAC
jgi:hypothetical protein